MELTGEIIGAVIGLGGAVWASYASIVANKRQTQIQVLQNRDNNQISAIIAERQILSQETTSLRNEMREEISKLKTDMLSLREKNLNLETENIKLTAKVVQLETEMTMLREKNIFLEDENNRLIGRVQELENELRRMGSSS